PLSHPPSPSIDARVSCLMDRSGGELLLFFGNWMLCEDAHWVAQRRLSWAPMEQEPTERGFRYTRGDGTALTSTRGERILTYTPSVCSVFNLSMVCCTYLESNHPV